MNGTKGAPLVTVIIPCYNDAEYLPYAVGAVLSQTHRNLEVLIVDDGSTDNTTTVATDLTGADARVRYLCGTHGGPSSARNHGVRSCTGEYLQFLDADDALAPEKLEFQVAYLQDNPDVGIVYNDVRYFSTDDLHARRLALRDLAKHDRGADSWVAALAVQPRPVLEKLLDQNICPVNCPLVRRDVISRVGMWNERLRAMEDWEYWLRCAAAGVVFAYHSDERARALVRARERSLSTNRDLMSRYTVEARISLGPHLSDSRMRLANYVHGRSQSRALGASGHMRRVVRLAVANRCVPVFAEILGLRAFSLLTVTCVWRLWGSVKRILPGSVRHALRRLRRASGLPGNLSNSGSDPDPTDLPPESAQ